MMSGQWLKSIQFKLTINENDLNIGLDNDNHVEFVVGIQKRYKTKQYGQYNGK